MLQDGLILSDSSVATNFQIQYGTSLPASGNNTGEMFYLTSGTVGLYIFDGTQWTGVTAAVELAGLNVHEACRVASTANITTLSGLLVIDGVTLIAGNRVLVKNQGTASANGVYVADASTWTRAADFDGSPSTEVTAGDFLFITEGTLNHDTGWTVTTDGTITIGSTALSFAQFTGANAIPGGSSGQIQYNSAGTFTGSTKLSFDNTTATLKVSEDGGSVPGVITSGTGLALSVYPATHASNVAGSDLNLVGGQGVRAGGAVNVTGGQENTAGFGGGAVNIAGGAGAGGTGNAGSVVIAGGVGTAVQGQVVLKTAGASRLTIDGDGSWNVGGSDGTSGQVLTSAGAGASPSWTTTVATNVWSGQISSDVALNAVSVGTISAGNYPGIHILNGTRSADNQIWRIWADRDTDSLLFSATTDAGVSTQWMTVVRSGGSATSITLAAPAIDFTGLTGGLKLNGVAGTSGQVLTSNGAAAPSWAAPTGGAAGTLTGTTLASNVVTSSLTSVGTLSSLTVSGAAKVSGDVTALGVASSFAALGNSNGSGTYPTLMLVAGSAPANARVSQIRADRDNGQIVWYLNSDAMAGTAWLTVNRAASVASSVTIATSAMNFTGLTGGLQLNGATGTTGQVLTSNGAAAPTWQTVAIGYTPVNKAGDTMTGALVLNADPSAALGAATKQYVDNLISGILWKAAVDTATTVNITLSGGQTVDGVAMGLNNRVLVKNQTDPTQNGVYIGAVGAWTRASDWDTPAEVNGAAVYVKAGSTQANTSWVQTTDVLAVGTQGMAFSQFSGSTGGVAKTGDTMSGNLTISKTLPELTLNTSTAADFGRLVFTAAGSTRWLLGKNNATESGSNAGSNFYVQRFTDAGAAIDLPLQINRATGLTTLTSLTVSGALTASGSLTGTLTGAASLNVLKAGDTMTGTLTVGDGTGGGVSRNIRAFSTAADINIGASSSTVFGLATNTVALIAQDVGRAFPLGIGTIGGQPVILGTTNAERMRIAADGKVGVGTTGSTVRLQMGDGSGLGSSESLRVYTSIADVWIGQAGGTRLGFAANTAAMIVHDGTSRAFPFAIGTAGAQPLVFATNDIERVRIMSTGEVGVGTTSPGQFFDIKKDQNAATFLRVQNSTSGTASYTGLSLHDGVTNKGQLLQFSAGYTSSNQFIADGTALNAGGVGGLSIAATNATTGDIRFYSGGTTERMRLLSSGNVSIGTTSSYRKLSVIGNGIMLSPTDALTGAFIDAMGDSEIGVQGGAYYNSFSSPNYLFTARSTSASGMRTAGGEVVFWGNTGLTSGTAFTSTERMRISTIGNIGVGTSAPTSNGATFKNIDLRGTTGGGGFLYAGDTAAKVRFGYSGASGGAVLGTVVSEPIVVHINSSEVMRWLVGGAISFGVSGTATGTVGQVLTSNGSGSAPTWAAAATAGATLPRATSITSAAVGQRVAVSTSQTVTATTWAGGGSIAVGDIYSIYNDSASPITISAGAGLTMYKDGTASSVGSVTLAARGSCTIWYNTVSEVVINGSIV